MKKSLLALVAVLMSVLAMAQAPQKMTYQAVVRDNNGQLVSNGNVGVRITIVRGSETGTEVYSQTETVRTNDNGLFTTMIGGTGFDAIDWGNGPYYLKSEVDPDGGSNYILTTTQQMVSVPYALHAGTVDSIIGGVNFTESDPIFSVWNKDYNDLINKPTIPTNVSELTNDAGYITNFTETQMLSISNDTIYLTGGSYVKLPAGFSGDYNDLTNKPTIPTVPTNVSEFTNDAGYLTSFTEAQVLSIGHDTIYLTGGSYVKLPAGFSGNYNDLTNKPTIPTVPTNVSEFTNDAGYLTSFTEAQVLSIGHDTIYLTGGSYVKLPAGFSGDYNDLTNKPTIPTVPTNVSEFTNDAGYLTSFTEAQVLSIGHDTIYLTGGSYVKLPAGFSGNYNDLTNKPTIPTVPTNVSAFTNDAGYITSAGVPTNVSEFTNDAGYLTSYTETQTLANVAALGNAVETQIKQLSDPTEELDAVNLRTLSITINNIVIDWTHRFDSLAHRYDSIASRMDSIIAYQDSVIDTLSQQLAIMGVRVGDTTAIECDSFIWYGTTYLTTGDYEHRLTNALGFDSIVTLHLTINNGTHNSETQIAASSYTWHETEYSVSGNYTYSYTNSEGCASVDTLHLTIEGFDANGASFALFSVSATKQVKFSKGNLQYSKTGTHTVRGGGSATGTWRFAEHQYDYIGSTNSNISSSYTGWIDLFGWGTSGYNSGKTAYQPWSNSDSPYDYLMGTDYNGFDLNGAHANSDWGVYNAISNGGNAAGMWRTLTKDEWNYLLFSRSGSRYAKAIVNGVTGLIIFPNGFSQPEGITISNTNTNTADYSTNIFSMEEWAVMESVGCVFLPTSGYRIGSTIYLNYTMYWSSSQIIVSNSGWGSYCAVDIYFRNNTVGVTSTITEVRNHYGLAIRLVKDIE